MLLTSGLVESSFGSLREAPPIEVRCRGGEEAYDFNLGISLPLLLTG